MSGKHLCQLRNGEKAELLHELRDVVRRLDAVENSTPAQPKYDLNDLPNFLREKLPKFKKNLDLVPLITHTSADEVMFTSEKNKVLIGQSEDPHKTFALIPGPGSPFKPDYVTSDKLCDDFCNAAAAAERARLGVQAVKDGRLPQPVCLRQEPNDAPRDPKGNMYDCNHGRGYEGIMVCNPRGGHQSYLCTHHVYPQ